MLPQTMENAKPPSFCPQLGTTFLRAQIPVFRWCTETPGSGAGLPIELANACPFFFGIPDMCRRAGAGGVTSLADVARLMLGTLFESCPDQRAQGIQLALRDSLTYSPSLR